VDEAIADPPYVHDEPVAVDAELVAQPAGVGVQRPRGAEVANAPDLAQELVLREDPRRLAGQHAQQRELLLREGERLAAQPRRARLRVDVELADAQSPGPAAVVGAAQQRRQAAAQLRVRERLADVVVGPAPETAPPAR